jgi:hypothetical protein
MRNLLIFILALIIIGCNIEGNNNGKKNPIVEQKCQSCHEYPDPSGAPKQAWIDHILPSQGFYFGRFEFFPRDRHIETLGNDSLIETTNLYPKEPTITQEEWNQIVNYYVLEAPDDLHFRPEDVAPDLDLFEVADPDFRLTPPHTISIQWNKTKNKTVIGNFVPNRHTISFVKDKENIKTKPVIGPAVKLLEKDGEQYSLIIGQNLAQNDQSKGQLIKVDEEGQTEFLLRNLNRPTDFEVEDIDGDGTLDAIICQHGNLFGKVSLFKNVAMESSSEVVIIDRSGSINVNVADFDNNGKKDIIVLFGQGDEGAYIFYQQDDGSFTEKRVLTFPAIYGSSDLDVLDMDKDGDLDLVYTNGDNSGYTNFAKPYHGVRTFINKGKENFIEKGFLHQNGAYRTEVDDFDGDGDFDFATISFYPDYDFRALEGFIFWENNSGEFTPLTFNSSISGRWFCMDKADIDDDGDMDLLLGSFTAFPPSEKLMELYQQWKKVAPSYVILKNTSIK